MRFDAIFKRLTAALQFANEPKKVLPAVCTSATFANMFHGVSDAALEGVIAEQIKAAEEQEAGGEPAPSGRVDPPTRERLQEANLTHRREGLEA